MLPGDVVLPMLLKMDVIQKHPKSEKLSNVVSGDDVVVADFEDPTSSLTASLTFQFFLLEAS